MRLYFDAAVRMGWREWEVEVDIHLFLVPLGLNSAIYKSDDEVEEGNWGRRPIDLPREDDKVVEVDTKVVPIIGAFWKLECKDIIDELLIIE